MKHIFTALIFSLCFLDFFSCKSTSLAQKQFEKIEPKAENFITQINESLPYTDEFKNKKFLFLRFYHINYNSGFKMGYVWRSMLGIMGTAPDGNYYSHTAINTSLSDDFIGATFKGKNAVKYECVQNPKTNPYLIYMNGDTTTCTVMALPCTETEWENCKKLIEYAVNENGSFKFAAVSAFAMPLRHKRNMRRIKNMDLINESDKITLPLEKEPQECFDGKRKYLCTGFIMKVFSKGIAKVGNAVEQSNVHFNGFLPADFFNIAGVQKLFTCRIAYYDKAVKEYLKLYPQFSQYFTEFNPTHIAQAQK